MMRFREKLLLLFSAIAIIFTLLVVLDLQMDLGYSGHHLVSTHGKVHMGDGLNKNGFYGFRRKFLQRGNGSKEQSGADVSGTSSTKDDVPSVDKNMVDMEEQPHDNFEDLFELVVNADGTDGIVRIIDHDRLDNPSMAELKGMKLR